MTEPVVPPMSKEARAEVFRQLHEALRDMIESTEQPVLDEKYPQLIEQAEMMLLEDMPLVWLVLTHREQRAEKSVSALAEATRGAISDVVRGVNKALRKATRR